MGWDAPDPVFQIILDQDLAPDPIPKAKLGKAKK
jgi:hypothetical protein